MMNIQNFKAGILPSRAVIEVTGQGSRSFLHNLLTCDVETLREDQMTYGALLTPQGKILFDIFVQDFGDGVFYVDCAESQSQELLKRLNFYKLRAQVTIECNPLLCVLVFPSQPEEFLTASVDPRTPFIGWRSISIDRSLYGEAHREFSIAEGYDAARIGLGLADSDADLGSGEFFPHEANLDQFGGVSFTKGCYIGQEVVSRMEHRGTARSRILPVELEATAPPKGSEIRSGGKQIGTLLSSADRRALALIRLDRLAEVEQPLLTGAVRLHVLKPRWARYEVAGAEGTA